MHAHRSWIIAAALAAPLVFTLGCDDDDDDNGGGPSGTTVLVTSEFDAQNGVVGVSDDGADVTGATVTLNGTAATAGAAGVYNVALPAPLTAGDDLDLNILFDDATVDGLGDLPEAGVITAPADLAEFGVDQEIPITWTSTADPARWVVEAEGATLETFDVAGGATRAFNIPAGDLGAGTWTISVVAVNDGAVTGDTEAGSTMTIRNVSVTNPGITVTAP
ncbi:MAG: hypothetical protein ACREMH_05410 [Gemmatimonadales bacterium]